jgi:hypothetical protein
LEVNRILGVELAAPICHLITKQKQKKMEESTKAMSEAQHPKTPEESFVSMSEHIVEIPESRGEKLINVSFNPSASGDVDNVKRACAYMIDIVEAHRAESIANGTLNANREFLMDHALGEIINAQMCVVKALTFEL